eukprot:358866-Pelagomonas_calceolata.AAC.7
MQEWNMSESDLSRRGRDQNDCDDGAQGLEGGMSEEEFRRNLHAKLKSTGVLGTVKVLVNFADTCHLPVQPS